MSETFQSPYKLPRVNEIFDFAIDLNRVIAVREPYFTAKFTRLYIIVEIVIEGHEQPLPYYHPVPLLECDKDLVLVRNKDTTDNYPKKWMEIDHSTEEVFEMMYVKSKVEKFINAWRG